MRAGRLRHRIRLKRQEKVADGGGGHSLEWVDVATVWARVAPLSGNAKYAAQQTTAETTHEVEIRYRRGVDERMRVLHRDRPFKITAILNPEEKNERLLLLCAETKP